jgi:cell division protein FtsW
MAEQVGQLDFAYEADADAGAGAKASTDATQGGSALPAGVLILASALMAVGLVMVASASASLDRALFEGHWWTTTFGRQFIFLPTGAVLMLGLAGLGPRLLRWRFVRWWVPIGFAAIVAVALVLVLLPGIGSERQGSSRWLRFGPAAMEVGIQPSELAKLALIGVMAAWFGAGKFDPRSFWRGFVPGAVAVGAFVALVGKEDLGTAALLGVVGGALLFIAGCRWRYLAVLAVLGIAGGLFLLHAADYRMDRLDAHRKMWDDPQGSGYHAVQSLTTIASGGWFGTGLGAGVQKYGYVPESRTDFIFAIICEETGVLGGLVVIGLYVGLVVLGLRIAWQADRPFERLLAFGLTMLIGLQAAMHVAVVTVVAPTTGISLPLVSAGGTGVLVFSAAAGVLAAVGAQPTERTGVAAEVPLDEETLEADDEWEDD